MFPRLLKFEANRRPKTEDYCAILKDCGFSNVDVLTFAETRKIYDSVTRLLKSFDNAKGKVSCFSLPMMNSMLMLIALFLSVLRARL